MFKNIYVFSPTGQATGGTELLQQLVYKLTRLGQNAYMHYTQPYENSKVQNIFEPRYHNPIAESIDDRAENLIIVSEACIYYLLSYKHIQKAVWWLSVDFYGGSFRLPCDFLHKCFYKLSDIIYQVYDKNWIHLTQSEYAYRYCLEERGINKSNIFNLSDYLSKDFIDQADKKSKGNRLNQVLYNPKKGIAFTQSLISRHPDITWIPIINMTSAQIAQLMSTSKLYIDFGNHPGKDRIPREAAICGCCVITGMRGAAANSVDIPISSKYKFQEKDDQFIIRKISYIFDNFEECSRDFDDYRTKIKQEETVFGSEINSVFIEMPPRIDKISLWKKIFRPYAKFIVYTMKFGPTLFGYDRERK